MDEAYIKIKGKWHYLYRTIDADGLILDIWLRKKRDTQTGLCLSQTITKTIWKTKGSRNRESAIH